MKQTFTLVVGVVILTVLSCYGAESRSASNCAVYINVIEADSLPKVNTPEDKIVGLSRVWSEIKYNFVNIDQLDFDIDSLYIQTIPRVINTTNDIEYYDELERMMAKFKDGHTNIVRRSYTNSEYVNDIPGTITEIEGKYYFTSLMKNVGVDSMLLGAEIKEVSGMPVIEYMELNCLPQCCASTERSRWRSALSKLHMGPVGSFLEGRAQTSEGKIVDFKLQYNWETISSDDDDYWFLAWGIFPPRERISVQWYDSVARVTIKDFKDDMGDMLDSVMADLYTANPHGVIIDLRFNGGGETDVAWKLQMYTYDSDTIHSFGYQTRINEGYGRAQGNYREEYEDFYTGRAYKTVEPEIVIRDKSIKPLKCPIVFLIGVRSFSACEDLLVNMYELPNRPLFIGEETGGSSGAPLVVELPHGALIRICTLRELFPFSKKPFLNKGIIPDITITTNLDNIKQKRDVALNKAITLLTDKLGH